MQISRMIGLVDIRDFNGIYPTYKTIYEEQGIKDFGYFKKCYLPKANQLSNWIIRRPKYDGMFDYFDQCILRKKINGQIREIVIKKESIFFKDVKYKDIWQGVFNE